MLTSEDSLRLNVLLQQEVHALRIDEGKLLIHALTPRGEARVALHPNCAEEKYLRQVLELISSHVLGVPHGYPSYLKRWTRMGHARTESLANLLKLGELEAVAAVVHAQGLSDELARRAWWVLHSPEHARAMLQRTAVVQGSMGPILAEFLVEFLAFEEVPAHMVESVRLVLQPGLISAAVRQDLWQRGARRTAYRVGFLKTLPDDLPDDQPGERAPHPALERVTAAVHELALAGQRPARLLLRVLQPAGQRYLETVQLALGKCTDQGVVVHLFEALEAYFAALRLRASGHRRLQEVLTDAARGAPAAEDPELRAEIQQLQDRLAPEDRPLLESLLVLAGLGEPLLAPIFGNTDAVGSGLRQALLPITDGLSPHLRRLCP